MKQKSDTEYQLFMRFALVNIVAAVALWVAWRTDWPQTMIAEDTSYFCRILVALFVFAAVNCGWRLWKTSRDLNIARRYRKALETKDADTCASIESGHSRLASYLHDVKGVAPADQVVIADDLKDTLDMKLSDLFVHQEAVIFIGLAGTVVGIVIALKGFGTGAIGDQTKLFEMFKAIMPGFHVMANATLISLLASVWLSYLLREVNRGLVQLSSIIVSLGVRRETASRKSEE